MPRAAPLLRSVPVQRRSAERLTRILDACAALLDEAGYDALSTRAVALRAGVPIGSVYRFFGNKREMVGALAQRNLERYMESVTERLLGGAAGARTAAPADGAGTRPAAAAGTGAEGTGAGGPGRGGAGAGGPGGADGGPGAAGPGARGWREALDVLLDEYLAMKRGTPGFALVDFGNQIPVGDPRAEPNHRVARRLTDLLAGYLGRRPDEGLRRTFLVAVETADALVRLAFRVAPGGDEAVLREARELLRAYLGRVLDGPPPGPPAPAADPDGATLPGTGAAS
ncbi:TetR/AcrR family transcriptional regulator [Streptomyces sp. NPDC052077]|uniref:TetR/AcrR family transcriptional regulator n=1 Tax=Streptomyces sp. NPDC052077 TaxID=3154757 RepID=UPI00342B687B